MLLDVQLDQAPVATPMPTPHPPWTPTPGALPSLPPPTIRAHPPWPDRDPFGPRPRGGMPAEDRPVVDLQAFSPFDPGPCRQRTSSTFWSRGLGQS